jgi:hypothetical protein
LHQPRFGTCDSRTRISHFQCVDQQTKSDEIFVALATERNSALRRVDLADLTASVAVADDLSFRAAAARIGVTPSALKPHAWVIDERLSLPNQIRGD